MDRSHLNQKHMKIHIVCKSLFTKGVQNVHICTDTYLETFSSLVNCSVNNNLSEIGPYRNEAFLQYLNESKRTKSKMLVFCTVLIFTFIFMIFGIHLLDR